MGQPLAWVNVVIPAYAIFASEENEAQQKRSDLPKDCLLGSGQTPRLYAALVTLLLPSAGCPEAEQKTAAQFNWQCYAHL